MMWCRERPASLGPCSDGEANFRRKQHVVAPTLEDLADDLLGRSAGVHVGGVDEVDAVVKAQIDLLPGLVDAGRSDSGEGALPAERHRAHGQDGHAQARASKQPVLHGRTVSILAATTVAGCAGWRHCSRAVRWPHAVMARR